MKRVKDKVWITLKYHLRYAAYNLSKLPQYLHNHTKQARLVAHQFTSHTSASPPHSAVGDCHDLVLNIHQTPAPDIWFEEGLHQQ
jgi:hypothetical protein